ncbi:hypothetical protein [Mucilaginibacter paludis]|uniref:Uncharacterized protein n=1 Tax=Mucilaginibacter paludis DSM 18603 TaxID=714943 RepID=H1YBY0_9SPHI|nr:hypothetical protein [Mucilaginibacter paludis]EHQ27058.1 hypothetical protein Mucpa_2950 [Mucilaginibacter paludis DSM 18603]
MNYLVIYDLKSRTFDFESYGNSDALITNNIALMQQNKMEVLCAGAADKSEQPHFSAGYRSREIGLLERLYREYEAATQKAIKRW